MVDCMQFLLKNRLNGCQIFGWFGFIKTKSEPNFGFLHIPTVSHCLLYNHNTIIYDKQITH